MLELNARTRISELQSENPALLEVLKSTGDGLLLCFGSVVDAVACGLELGHIGLTGRFQRPESLRLEGPIVLTQADVRELQLAKGAIAAITRSMARVKSSIVTMSPRRRVATSAAPTMSAAPASVRVDGFRAVGLDAAPRWRSRPSR